MPHLLYRLNGVPEDEVIEIRRLLEENGIDYYETSAGMFGVSIAAVWLRDDGEIERAQRLLDSYQQQRYRQAREAYEQQQRDGSAETLLQRLLRHPLQSLIYLTIIALILYFSITPFLMLTRQ